MIRKPYLVFLGDVEAETFAKTAYGIRDWLPGEVVGQWRLPGCKADLGVPDYGPAEAAARGAQSMLIGVASAGGQIPQHWRGAFCEALDNGLDIVSGMHTRLASVDGLLALATRLGRRLHDVRHADRNFPIATGLKRSGLRLLTVGTDCALGKKYTALALTRALQARGHSASFRATGQTGIMIAGEGIAVDAVVADFIAGASETLSPDAAPHHWDVIEGQGSLFHPAYAGVTLGLVHGSQPDAMVLCHDPTRRTIAMCPHLPMPSLKEAARRYVEAAVLTNPHAQVLAVSLNTSKLAPAEARAQMEAAEAELGVPCFDPLRFGIERVVDALETRFGRAALVHAP